MSKNVPRVGQAFAYPILLRLAGVILADPDASAYVSGDITAFFGTNATEVTLTCTQRGTSPILDVAISAGQHTGTPILIRVEDRSGTTFDDDWMTLFTLPAYKYPFDGNYVRELDAGDTVLRHAPVIKSGLITTLGLWVEGEVP